VSLSNDDVLKRFREHRKGNGGNVSTDGKYFNSYNATIAQWLHAEDNLKDKEAIVILNGDRLSPTTSQHQAMFRSGDEPVVSYSALDGAGLTGYGRGWNQGPIRDGVQLVDHTPSLNVSVYEDQPEYETILNNIPIGATPYSKEGRWYTATEYYCHYGYEERGHIFDNLDGKCPGSCWGCPDRKGHYVNRRERGYRGYHRAGTVVLRYDGYDYLCGFDEGSYFVSRLPMQVKTVEGAFLVLMPKAVMGKKYLRQGEWFFVEAPREALDDLELEGRRSIEDEFRKLTDNGRFLPGCEAIGKAYWALARQRAAGMGPKYTFTGFKRISNTAALPRVNSRSNAHTVTYLYDTGLDLLAAGTVRHPQHRRLKLEPKTVYTVHKNNSLGDWSAQGRVD